MAHSDKNILITPNIGSTTADPKIVFSGADASTGAQNITLQVYPTNSGTLSFEGSSGQLFSITNSMSGTIYSVNDISGIPSIEVLDSGLVKLAQYSGNVLLGTGTDNGVDKLQVNGALSATTLKGSTLVSTVANGTAPLTVTSSTVVNNLNADLWDGYQFASYLNQGVRTTDGPTFQESYVNGWFRSNTSGNGLYNSATSQHFYSDDDNYWNIAGGTEANGLRFRDEHAGTIRGYVYATSSNEIGFLDNSGNWTLRMSGGTAYATTFSGSLSGTATNATQLGGTAAQYYVKGTGGSAWGYRTTGLSGDSAQGLLSGFYDGSGMSNMPTSDWYHLIASAHNNSYSGNQYEFHIATAFWDKSNFYMRSISPGSVGSWRKLIHDGNIGGYSSVPTFQVLYLDSNGNLNYDKYDTGSTATINIKNMPLNFTGSGTLSISSSNLILSL